MYNIDHSISMFHERYVLRHPMLLKTLRQLLPFPIVRKGCIRTNYSILRSCSLVQLALQPENCELFRDMQNRLNSMFGGKDLLQQQMKYVEYG